MTKAKTGFSLVALGAALLLAGCDSWPDSLNPGKWVDSSDANANVPGPQKTYPKLSTVPDRPPPRDEEAQKKSEEQLEADRQAGRAVAAAPPAEGLVADRADARYTDQPLRREEPKEATPPPPAAPEPPKTASAAPSEPPPASAPRQAAATPPPPPAAAPPAPPPAAAPTQVTSTPPSAAAAPPAPPPAARVPPAPPTQVAALPPPAAPPPPAATAVGPPVVAMAPVRSPGDPPPSGAASAARGPNSTLIWGPPPPDIDLMRGGRAYADASSFAVPQLSARAGGPVASVIFASGSSRLAPDADALLRQVAAQYQRSGGTVSVIGHASQTAADQNNVRRQIANFSVSMDRATTVARALQRYGVPGEAIAISAQIDSVALNDAGGQRADVFLR